METGSQKEIAAVVSDVLGTRRQPVVTVGQLEGALLSLFPASDALDWDKTGLLVGDTHASITGICVALDATVEAISACVRQGANVLLTHHPVFLDALQRFAPPTDGNIGPGSVIWEAIHHGVACMDFHTALDVNPLAAAVLPRMLGLESIRVLDPLPGQPHKGFGQICQLAAGEHMTLSQLAARSLAVFGRIPRVYGDPAMQVNRICTATGSASSLVEDCLAQQVDVLVCGEMRYHAALDARSAGLGIIELGHDVSELPLSALLAQILASLGIAENMITLLDQNYNWWTPEAMRQ